MKDFNRDATQWITAKCRVIIECLNIHLHGTVRVGGAVGVGVFGTYIYSILELPLDPRLFPKSLGTFIAKDNDIDSPMIIQSIAS